LKIVSGARENTPHAFYRFSMPRVGEELWQEGMRVAHLAVVAPVQVAVSGINFSFPGIQCTKTRFFESSQVNYIHP